MSKKYVDVGPHGYYGDFYRIADCDSFRADSIEIATKIAFNNWLYNFDNLYRSCRLDSIEPGKFTVTIWNHSRSGATTGSESRTYVVEYFGPGNMFEPCVIQDQCDDPVFRGLLEKMKKMAAAGDARVRAGNRTGRVMFSENISFPRYHADGEWWSSEHRYLDTDSVYAAEQMKYALADNSVRDVICKRNSDTHSKRFYAEVI